MAQRLLQQRETADNIGLDEGAGTVDRVVDMALRRQMHHDVGSNIGKDRLHPGGVADVGLLRYRLISATRASEARLPA